MVGFKNFALLAAALLPNVFAAPVKTADEGITAQSIADKYIVTLKPTTDLESHISWVSDIHARSLNARSLSGVKQRYSIKNFQAYAGAFDSSTIEEIKNSPEVC